MPGKSKRWMVFCPTLISPCIASTVVPGKLLVFWVSPVNRLNKVDFPQFGLPTRAKLLGKLMRDPIPRWLLQFDSPLPSVNLGDTCRFEKQLYFHQTTDTA